MSVGGKNIMFDCGMHMGYDDERRFPDFTFISKSGNFTNAIDCVIITHLYPIRRLGVVLSVCVGERWDAVLTRGVAVVLLKVIWITAARCPTSRRCAATTDPST